MNKIKQIIREEINRLFEDEFDYDLYELMDEVRNEVIEGFLDAREKGGGKQPWRVVPAGRLKKIWEDYIKFGHVRDVKGIEIIENLMTRNALKLNANTELSGHVNYGMEDELEPYGLTPDDIWEGDFDFGDYIEGSNGQLMISDYGLQPILKLVMEVRRQSTPEQKLITLDKMLNVVHQRSDLAELFIQGGSTTLNDISGYDTEDPESGGYDTMSSISGRYRMSDYR